MKNKKSSRSSQIRTTLVAAKGNQKFPIKPYANGRDESFFPCNESLRRVRNTFLHEPKVVPPELDGLHFVPERMAYSIDAKNRDVFRVWETLRFQCENGCFVRLCPYQNDELFISMINVPSGIRNKGIGTALMSYVIELIRRSTKTIPKISLEVNGSQIMNEPVDSTTHQKRMAFFRRFGFRLNKKLSDYPRYNLMELVPESKEEVSQINTIQNFK